MTYGPDKKRMPMTAPPPCWSCPKQPESVPLGDRRPLDPGADFGNWFYDLLDWYAEGREVGFEQPDDLMRQVAGLIGTGDRRAELASTQRLLLTVLKR